MQSKATTVKEYLAALPPERRDALEAVRAVIRRNLDSDYEEGMQYGMIGYYVPHRVFPPGYHCDPKQPLPFAGLAAQKNHLAVYLMAVYGDSEKQEWLRQEWTGAGKKLDMGKSCIRFKRVEDLALDVIGEAIRRVPAKKFIEMYEKSIPTMNTRTTAGAKKTAGKKAPARKAAAKPVKKAAKAAKKSGRR